MFKTYRRWRKNRAIKKIKPGDGHPLKPYKFWQPFSRSLFFIKLTEEDGKTNTYAVDVHYFNENETAELYRNGKHEATSPLPATFPVPSGYIEVATTSYGLKRMHYVTQEGNEQQLSPHPRSMEGLRMRLDMNFPKLSRLISILAILILISSVILGLPQLIALISQIEIISEHIGTFESPINIPGWANTALLIGGLLAALERAASLRNHWLIDMETSWWDS